MRNLIFITIFLLMITAFLDIKAEYGYYQLLRWLVFICSGILAYKNYANKLLLGIFCFIAILFNPIIPVYFSKDTWRIIDMIVGLGFIIYFLKGRVK